MTNLVDDFNSTFGDRARTIDAEWRQHKARILADANLSQQGKAAALTDADERRREVVGQLQSEAESWARFEIADAHKDLAKVRAAAADKRRKVLGDQLTADLARRRFSMMAPSEMLAAADTAPDEFHATLYRELVDLELRERVAGGDTSAGGALLNLGSILPEDVRELENALTHFERTGDSLLENLDATAYRERVGSALGVNPEFVE